MARLLRILIPSFLIAALVVLFVQIEPLSGPRPSSESLLFEARVKSTAAGVLKLFLVTGDGYTPLQVLDAEIKSGAMQTVRFLIPPGSYHAFRIEPASPGGVTEFFGARVVDLAGMEMFSLEAGQFHKDRDSSGVEKGAGSLVFPGAAGEGAVFTPDAPAELRSSLAINGRDMAMMLLLITACLCPLLWKAEAAGERLRPRLVNTASRVAAWSRAHPVAALFTTAVAVVMLSCHPVVFFGRSFVSPNNRATCLYDSFPTVPDSPKGPIEDPKGSDMGATMWAHLPYAMLEHRAIFRDHELPLWNRATSCGVPLLGQGQSMIGDPLHWIPIAANGAAWSWDVKVLLSRVFFVLGIGLVVFAAIGRIGIALLLAASSAFIGFFAYRFNHAAMFSMAYAPWILLAWLKIAQSPTARTAVKWGALLIAADWLELNSGTAKEASMLLAGLNVAGAMCVHFARESAAARARKLGVAIAAGIIFLLLSAPCWLVFLDALKDAYTSYNTPRAFQIPPGLALGLFDDMFYREVTAHELHGNPSANFLILLGIIWALANVRTLLRERTFAALAVGAVPLVAIVFGAVPRALIVRLPLLGNISHVDNTFSCVLIVLLFPLAAFGLRECLDAMEKPSWKADSWTAFGFAAVLALAFFGTMQAVPRITGTPLFSISEPVRMSPFFLGYAAALFIALALLPWVARTLLRARAFTLSNVLLAPLCLFAMHFRHGMYNETKFDPYVMNPQARTDLRAPSPAVEFVKTHLSEPARVSGIRGVLTPGFNIVLGLDSMAGADALLSRWHRELVESARLHLIWDWRLVIEREIWPFEQPFTDLFNVRYFLGKLGEEPRALAGLKLIGTRDLDVYESPTVWPRAFFTDTISRYESVGDFTRLVAKSDRRPLAAVQGGERIPASLPTDLAARQVIPAGGYRLTGNTTTFTVDAPAAGVAVLSDAYEAGNFRVSVDGAPASYFRVNHAFCGVPISQPGKYTIRFEYWPRRLTLSLWLSAAGLALLAVAGVVLGITRSTP